MRLALTNRSTVRRRVLAGAALLLPSAAIVGCSEEVQDEFRAAALSSFAGGVKTSLSGIVDGLVAVLTPDPPTGEQSGVPEGTDSGTGEQTPS